MQYGNKVHGFLVGIKFLKPITAPEDTVVTSKDNYVSVLCSRILMSIQFYLEKITAYKDDIVCVHVMLLQTVK